MTESYVQNWDEAWEKVVEEQENLSDDEKDVRDFLEDLGKSLESLKDLDLIPPEH